MRLLILTRDMIFFNDIISSLQTSNVCASFISQKVSLMILLNIHFHRRQIQLLVRPLSFIKIIQ